MAREPRPYLLSTAHGTHLDDEGRGAGATGWEAGGGEGMGWTGVGNAVVVSRLKPPGSYSDKRGRVTPLGLRVTIRSSAFVSVTLQASPTGGVRARHGQPCPRRPSPQISSDPWCCLARRAWASPPCSPDSSRTTQRSLDSVSLVKNHRSQTLPIQADTLRCRHNSFTTSRRGRWPALLLRHSGNFQADDCRWRVHRARSVLQQFLRHQLHDHPKRVGLWQAVYSRHRI